MGLPDPPELGASALPAGTYEDQVVIVTGGGTGLGKAMAVEFARLGARIAVMSRKEEHREAGVAAIEAVGAKAAGIACDIRQPDAIAEAFDAVESQLGAPSVLVNNAAVVHFASIVDTTLEDYRRVIDINQVGTFLGIQAVIEPMKRAGGGSIINVSSIDGLQAKNGIIAYAASKWAIRGMTKVAAIELGHHGIRVNSLHPGGINTVMGNPTGYEKIDDFYKSYPIPRAGRPEEMAQLALFLASDESSYSTGSEFVADGGWNAGEFQKALPSS